MLSERIYLVVIAALGSMLLTLGIYAWFISSQNDELRTDIKSYELALNQSVKISNQNEKEFIEYKEKNELVIENLNTNHENQLKRYKIFMNKKGEIENVKKSDDAINANVINNTLDWLREQTISSNTSKDDKPPNTK